MPNISFYLEQNVSGAVQVLTGTWAGIVNNSTSTAYKSTAASDSNGKVTINTVPGGSYTVYTSPSGTGSPPGGDWVLTGNANFIVSETDSSNDTTIPGRLVLSTATSKIVPGATKLQFRNNADSASNAEIADVGDLTLRTKISSYNGVSTAGIGVPVVYASFRNTGLTSAQTNAINYTPPASAGVYRLSIHYRPTATGASTSVGVTIAYKDSTGAISLTTLPFTRASATTLSAPPFTNTGAADFYATFIFEIDVSATAITVSTTGTFTGTTYNFSATLEQLA